eukprot:SAG31_NODE_876_length_11307_cov_3.506781_3_plen_158_part_00
MSEIVGGGGVFLPVEMVITGLLEGSLIVDWQIETPATIMTEAANLVQTAISNGTLIVSVDGSPVSAVLTGPVIYSEPDVNCIGSWRECGTDCRSYYEMTTAASGSGTDCPGLWNQERSCKHGEGKCVHAGARNGVERNLFRPFLGAAGLFALYSILS